MFLTAQSIRRLISELAPPLVDIEIPEGLNGPEREELERKREGLKTRDIEGSSFDMELDIMEQRANAERIPFLGKDRRTIPGTRPVVVECEAMGTLSDTWLTLPLHSYQVMSLETFNMPPWLCGFVFPRTTEPRCSLDVPTLSIAPGFRGKIAQKISSVDSFAWIERYFRFVSVRFALFITDDELRFRQEHIYPQVDMEREVEIYDGIWGKKTGDRLTTDGKPERGF